MIDLAIDYVIVVVPANDEGATVAACIGSIDAAAQVWGGRVDIVVAADGCVDATASIAAEVPVTAAEVIVRCGRWGSAGRARAIGTDVGLARMRSSAERAWIASTDADSVVPPGWLAQQADLAAAGADLVLGVVDLPGDADDDLASRFRCHYQWIGTEHPHVHGANLGIRASAYQQIGGWTHLSQGEEHDLLARAVAAGLTVRRDHDLPVITSARVHSRVRTGFATCLAGL